MSIATLAAEVQAIIDHANGAECLYRHRLCPNHCYTSGVRQVAITANAYWLIDGIIISSHTRRLQVRSGGFEYWTLKRHGRGFLLRCTDGNENSPVLHSQRIELSDFPLDQIEFFLEGGVLMLPGER